MTASMSGYILDVLVEVFKDPYLLNPYMVSLIHVPYLFGYKMFFFLPRMTTNN